MVQISFDESEFCQNFMSQIHGRMSDMCLFLICTYIRDIYEAAEVGINVFLYVCFPKYHGCCQGTCQKHDTPHCVSASLPRPPEIRPTSVWCDHDVCSPARAVAGVCTCEQCTGAANRDYRSAKYALWILNAPTFIYVFMQRTIHT